MSKKKIENLENIFDIKSSAEQDDVDKKSYDSADNDLNKHYQRAIHTFDKIIQEVDLTDEDGKRSSLYDSASKMLSIANSIKQSKMENILKLNTLKLQKDKLEFEKDKYSKNLNAKNNNFADEYLSSGKEEEGSQLIDRTKLLQDLDKDKNTSNIDENGELIKEEE